MHTFRIPLTGLFIFLIGVIQFQYILTVKDCLGEPNERPIIGILAQETSFRMKEEYYGLYKSYIAASYVKFIESGGARVVPIWLSKDYSYYRNILNQINGVILPGGSANFDHKNGYADAAHMIYRIAIELNSSGQHYPLWGTCLGFEAMTYIAAGQDICQPCSGMENVALPLEFKSNFRKSKLFKHAPENIINILSEKKVTSHFHKKCVTEKDFKEAGLSNEYRVVSINHAEKNVTYVSTMEHKQYPFYGTQYHPEKNSFEWADRFTGIPHSRDAIKVTQYFANFIVNEARKNCNSFNTKKDEMEALIYNYPPTYDTSIKSSFVQCYFFKK